MWTQSSLYTALLVQLVGILVVSSHNFSTIINPPPNFHLDIDGISVAPSIIHICALEKKHGSQVGGRAVCWGHGKGGKLNAPKDTLFVQIVSDQQCTCGITIEQTIQCWGCRKDVVHEPAGLYTQITAGTNLFCGVLVDNSINCWGTPTFPPPLGFDFVQVSCSGLHCCAINDKAFVHCWGSDHNLHIHNWEDDLRHECEPPMIDVDEPVSEDEDAFDAYGDESSKQEEEEFYEDEEDNSAAGKAATPTPSPAKQKKVTVQFKQISVGNKVSCGITLQDEDLMCWANEEHFGTDVFPHLLKGPFKQVSAGSQGVCAIRRQEALVDAMPHMKFTSNRELVQIDEQGLVIPDNNRFLTDLDIAEAKAQGRHPGMHCWGVIAQFIPEVIQWWPIGWDQVHIPAEGLTCAVSMESELFCFSPFSDILAKIPDIIIA